MTSRQLDEEAIFEVAREIWKPQIRAKYLDQVGADKELRSRLEERLRHHRRWQFGLRGLFVSMLVAAVLSAGLAAMYQQAMRAQQVEIRARLQAERAMRNAEQARMHVEQAFKAATEEETP
jgi:hypothetical protein